MTPEEFREQRRAYGLSQAGLAKFAGVTPTTIARWERGERHIHQGLARLTFEVLRLERELREKTN